MAKKQKPSQQSSKPKELRSGLGWGLTIDGLVRIVENFGWPGVILVLGFYFVEHNASADQKQQIIDLFVLGKGISGAYPFLVMGGLSVVIFLAQHFIWQRRVNVLNAEVQRLSKWKSEHQEAQIGSGLHHTTGGQIK